MKNQKRQNQIKTNQTNTDIKRPFLEHLNELKNRVFIVLLFFLLGTGIGYFLYDKLLSLLMHPLQQPLFYTSPSGGFDFTFRVSLLFGVLFALPVTLMQFLKFVEPLFSAKLKSKMLLYIVFSITLMMLGICFAYFICLPASLHFFSNFSSKDVKSLISTNEYLSFVISYIIGFSILFQLPLILLVANAIHRLSTKKLLSVQRYVIVIAFIIGAVLTPTPDPLNQTIMSAPIILLFYISILCVYIKNKQLKSI